MKITSDDIIREIENSSKIIISQPSEYKRQLASAMYFVSNRKLNHWSISKEVACYTFNVSKVSDAKEFFYDNGFVDVLSLDDKSLMYSTIDAFFNWSKLLKNWVDIPSKFTKDQNENRRIQLLIPSEILDEEIWNTKSRGQIKLPKGTHNEGEERYIHEYKYNFRNKRLVEDAKTRWKTNCWICGFSFFDTYGEWGKDFIEIHHLHPINSGERQTSVEDVRPLCSNCHQMIHRKKKMLTIQELKNIIESARQNETSD